jgi:hypothetical protein
MEASTELVAPFETRVFDALLRVTAELVARPAA